MKEKGGISRSRETEERGEISPLQREREEENTLANGQDYRSGRSRDGEILGDSRKGKERGRTGRKEELLKKSPGEKGRKAGEDGWSGSSQSPKKGSLYIIVLEPPPMSVPSQSGLHALLRIHRYRRA